MSYLTRNFFYIVTMSILAALASTVQAAEYSVISESESNNYKRSIDVRLSEKVSEKELRAIAMELKESEKKAYDRTFIIYLLPDMEVNSGAWATTHFNPDLEVQILGFTLEQEQKMARDAASETRDLVGVWEAESLGARLTLYRENGKLYLDAKYAEGSDSIEEMIETKSATGTQLVGKGGNPHGDYIVLDGKGNLQAEDGYGIFLKYKKIK